MADIAGVADPFTAYNPARWDHIGWGTLTVTGGTATLSGAPGVDRFELLDNAWTFDVQHGFSVHLEPGGTDGYLYMQSSTGKTMTAGKQGANFVANIWTGTGSNVQNFPYTAAFAYVRITRESLWPGPSGDYYLIYSSPDGVVWTMRNTLAVTPGETWGLRFDLGPGGPVAVSQLAGIAPDPGPDPDPDPSDPLDSPPYDTAGDPPYDIADLPAKPEPACATVLDLIREFSGAVRQAIRIVGPTTIEMVDPLAPLPAGWTQADADNVYHASNQALTAGAVVLSVRKGDLALTGGAELVADDVRLAVSDWRIPDRLPVYGLHPAPVQRVTHTFTPKGYSASVEFAHHTVPLEVRRT